MLDLSGKRVTVAGLGRFGGQIAAARWLANQGAKVLVTDRSPAEKLTDSVAQLAGLPIEYRLGEHRETDFTDTDLIVVSPALPPHHELLQAARSASVPITTEIQLFIERCPATIVGVTGSKGKSTTTALLGRMLETRFRTWIGGNIGRPLLNELPTIDKTHLVVLELSSFMLEYLAPMKWSPHISLVTMITSDHLDWHGSQAAYVEAKKNIVRFARPDDVAVLNASDPSQRDFAQATKARVVFYDARSANPLSLLIPGAHNQANAQAALAAAAVLGVGRDEAQTAVAGFRGLPHRLELVQEHGGVRYYNDSIATIPEAAVAALDSFPAKRVLQIVGGKDKGLPMTAMCNALVDRAKAVFCIGDLGPLLVEMMSSAPHTAAATVYNCGDLSTAVKLARSTAVAGDVVLLSPGCASYDQFTNFEARGHAFAELVRQ